MNVKIIEVRDEGTFIPMLCIDMQPSLDHGSAAQRAQAYYLFREGYACDGRPNISIMHLGMPRKNIATNDVYEWNDRTRSTAHHYIIENWETLKDGDVVDVQFILGETKEPKKSERFA